MSRRALLFQNLSSLFPLEVFMEFLKDFSCFLDFASLNNTKVISYNLCVWETQETQQCDHTAPQDLTLLVIQTGVPVPLGMASETRTPSRACWGPCALRAWWSLLGVLTILHIAASSQFRCDYLLLSHTAVLPCLCHPDCCSSVETSKSNGSSQFSRLRLHYF